MLYRISHSGHGRNMITINQTLNEMDDTVDHISIKPCNKLQHNIGYLETVTSSIYTKVDTFLVGLWDAAFCSNSILNTHDAAAKMVGLQGCVVPQSLLLVIAVRTLSIHPR